MSKKVKCSECKNMMNWALPVNVSDKNIDYAKECLGAAKRSVVCGYTTKTKSVSNEQYCTHYEQRDERDKKVDCFYTNEINKLETMINNYEESINKK